VREKVKPAKILGRLNVHLFGPMKVHLEDRNFILMLNSNAVSLTGYAARIKHSMLLASVTYLYDGKKGISVKGVYPEKEGGYGESGKYIIFVKNGVQVDLEPPSYKSGIANGVSLEIAARH
jgi:hypothetical protein